MSGTKIRIAAGHRCRSSAERIYDAWLDPAQVKGWMSDWLMAWGLAGDMRRVEIDARLGGRFFFSDQRGGGTLARHWGTYLELERPRRIAFTWIVDEAEEADPVRVELTLAPAEEEDGGGCLAMIAQETDAAWAAHRGRIEENWAGMLKACDERITPPPPKRRR